MNDPLTNISICIPTYYRANQLRHSLEAICQLESLPAEVIISDAGFDEETKSVVATYQAKLQEFDIRVLHIKSPEKALPFQRYFAAKHVKSEITLIIDDDISLRPQALSILLDAYKSLNNIGGIGLLCCYDDRRENIRRDKFKDYLLGIHKLQSGKLSKGGVRITMSGLPQDKTIIVDFLSGGAMSYPTKLLHSVPPLVGLYDLYSKGIGKGEDTILSHCMAEKGALYLLTNKLAIHPIEDQKQVRPYPTNGYKKGLAATIGRAHTLKWLRTSTKWYWLNINVLLLLEGIRCMIGILKRPFGKYEWARYKGFIIGSFLCLFKNNKIPVNPSHPMKLL